MEYSGHRTVDRERHRDIGLDQGESRVAFEVSQVDPASGGEVVDAHHLVAPASRWSQRCDPRNPAATQHHRTGGHRRPIPVYSNPMRRNCAGSRRLRASTTTGAAMVIRTLPKSSHRNSSHSVSTTTAAAPWQAA